MGAGLLGAIAGAGKGAGIIGQQMREDWLRGEDNAVWEARQRRLQELGIESAQATSDISAEAQKTRDSRIRGETKEDLAESRKHQAKLTKEERAAQEKSKDRDMTRTMATDAYKASLKTATDGKGLLGGSGWTGKEVDKHLSSRTATGMGLNTDMRDWTKDQQIEHARIVAESKRLLRENPAMDLNDAYYQVVRGEVPSPDIAPPMAGAKQGKDGKWYLQKDSQWFRVD